MLLSQVFHEIEKKIITSLRDNPKQTPESLEKSTQLSPDQIRRGIEWLKLKDLAIVSESQSSAISLGKNGIEKIVEIQLSDAEKAHLKESAEGVTKTNGLLAL